LATVVFSSEQQKLTGESRTKVESRDYRALIQELLAHYPSLDPAEMREMAIAIDGVIIHDPMLETFDKDAEIHFLHFVAGG